MFVTVQLNGEITIGKLVVHDANNVWRQATSTDQHKLGVLNSIELVEGVYWGKLVLAGTAYALAGSNIEDQGGWLGSDDEGNAVVTQSENCGIIAPLSRGQASMTQGDLILVCIR